MTTPNCPICGEEMNWLYYEPGIYECPNGPDDSPYHKLFLELVAVRKIVFRYKHDNASIREQLEVAWYALSRLSDCGWPMRKIAVLNIARVALIGIQRLKDEKEKV